MDNPQYPDTSRVPTTIKIIEQQNVGKAKYVVSFCTGKKHSDGSDFFDIRIFKSIKSKNEFIRALKGNGVPTLTPFERCQSAGHKPTRFSPNGMDMILECPDCQLCFHFPPLQERPNTIHRYPYFIQSTKGANQ